MTLRCKIKEIKVIKEVGKDIPIGMAEYEVLISCKVFGENEKRVEDSLKTTNIQIE